MEIAAETAASALLLISAMMPAATCAWVGVQHVRAPDALAAALRQPTILRRALTSCAARKAAQAWGTVEVGTGVAVCAVLLGPASAELRLYTLLWMTTMYAGFGLWLGALWRRISSATCGCGVRAEPADGLALLRASVLGGCAAVPMLFLLAGQDPVVPPYGWVFLPLAATLALLIWHLPDSVRTAREVP